MLEILWRDYRTHNRNSARKLFATVHDEPWLRLDSRGSGIVFGENGGGSKSNIFSAAK